jgi:hypothetical protein
MPTKKDKKAGASKRKKVYRPHPLRDSVADFNADAIFVGFGNEYTYDGAILGTADRTVVDRDVIVVDAKAPKAEVEKLLQHGAPRSDSKWVLANSHNRTQTTVIVYSCRLIVEICAQKMVDDGECEDLCEARERSQEWHDFNTFCAWHGENTPMFIEDYTRE